MHAFRYRDDVDGDISRGRQAPAKEEPADPSGLFARAAAAACDERKHVEMIRTDLAAEQEAALFSSLAPFECKRAERFRRPEDRRRYVAAHGRLRQLLAQRLELRPEQVALGCNRYGKPELIGRQASSGWHFSLSYSAGGAGEDLALCALSRWRRIGVDVEAVRPLDDADRLALRFFSAREYEIYRRLPTADRPWAFFNCWTRKEAFVKALGSGLSYTLADFDVSLAPGLPARILRVGTASGDRCGWRLQSIGPAGGRVAAVVLEQQR